MDLPKGYKIQTKMFKTVIVVEKIGEGGQGAVYKADYDGKAKALKWYAPNKLNNPDKFYKNIQNNIDKKAPTNAFLWCEDITEIKDGSFGYIMDLRPPEYKDFSLILLAKVKFESDAAVINAALNIVAGFRALHNRGYSYQDLNDGNFFINPKTGGALICDNDNVAPYGESLGIAGKCRYMAPEVVLGKKTPDIHTDRFSLSVILFLLLFMNHPLEGKATNPPCLTEELEREYYGVNPVFIFDPSDKSNSPVRGIHSNAINRWRLFPKYVRDMFVRAFSKEVMGGTKPRIIEKEWQEMLVRLRGEIIICSCGKETFVEVKNTSECMNCRRKIAFPVYLKTQKYNLAVYPSVKLYKCHTESDNYDFDTVSGEIIRSKNNPSVWGIKNLSGTTWHTVDKNQAQTAYPKDSVIQIKKDIKINFGGTVAEII